MITENNKRALYDHTALLALEDFRRANPKGRRYDKKGNELPLHPYSLSPNTKEAHEMYCLALDPDITYEDEVRVKAYCLSLKLQN